MKREITRMMRVPSLVRTKNGHVVNKWCGSCQHKEIQAQSRGTDDSQRHCKILDIYVEVDDVCKEWDLDDKLAAL